MWISAWSIRRQQHTKIFYLHLYLLHQIVLSVSQLLALYGQLYLSTQWAQKSTGLVFRRSSCHYSKERARLLGSPCEWRQISLACNLIPMQVGEWLGILINTITMNFHILERKVAKLKSLLGSVIGHTLSSYRRISQDCRFYNFCDLGSGTHFTSSNLKMYNQCGTTPFAFLWLLWKSRDFGTTISTHLRAILFDSWFLWCSLDGIMA